MSLNKQKIFLTARWENLAMINYEVDPVLLIPHLPPYTVLDLHQGKALISIVGFMFNNTKVFGLNWPFHSSFEEVNLRFYVKHFDGKVWKRGVVFKSEIVPKWIIAVIANALYREHYRRLPMKHSIITEGEDLHINYRWKLLSKWNHLNVVAETALSDIKPGSDEEFIFEHYWGYNKYDADTTIEYGVEHNVWQVHKVKEWNLECDVLAFYGSEFVPYLSAKPHSVFLAKGSEVTIRKPIFIRKQNTD